MEPYVGPITRILLRYGAGAAFGMEIGQQLALDTDVVLIASLGVAAVVEAFYVRARRRNAAKVEERG